MYTFDLIRNVFEDDFSMACRHGVIPSTRTRIDRTDNGVVLKLDVPGCSEEDVSVEVGNNFLSIEAEVGGEKISRTYTLPEASDPQTITADVTNGLLTVTIPNGQRRKIL